MKSLLIALCLCFFSMDVLADDTAPVANPAPVEPQAQVNAQNTAPAAPAAKREVARKKRHKKKKHRRHHRG